MYAPTYYPPAAAPSPAVRAAEAAILAAEGPYHVHGRYYADDACAAIERRRAAERQVRETTQRDGYRARQRVASAARVPAPRVVTWLTAHERARLDLAAVACDGCLAATHRNSLAEVRADLARVDADAVLVSPACLIAAGPSATNALAALVHAFPGVRVLGFLSEMDEAHGMSGVLLLGRAGARGLLDVRTPAGWDTLRAALAPRRLPDAFLRACVASVLADVRGDTDGASIADGLARFFCLAFTPDVTSAKTLATRLGVLPSSLSCRFFRAGLPSPRRYVAFARLTWAAWLGEQPGRSIADIANSLDASSPQSFHRTVRLLTGRSVADFRRTTTGRAMLDQYRATLVTPYRDTLRMFDPLGGSCGADKTAPRADVGQREGRRVAA